ncbi:oxygen-independent coproporphyrinogen III oxidase [bacterium]|nr:MAG: oxygen-independent coproporphyrinogen III oxidase [bacterium]
MSEISASAREILDPDLERLLEKYDRPGPRYTSYPTAPAWGELNADRMKQALHDYAKRDDAGEAPPLSLYVHVPFCERRCLYCGCNVVIAPQDKVSVPYMDVLEQDIRLNAAELGKKRRVSWLHLGGGTPTYLQPEQLGDMVGWLRDAFDFLPDAEVSVEVDPVVTTVDHLRKLRELGFNRISMGVQDTDPKVQEAVGRPQSPELTRDFYQHCRDLGFESVNMDLVYGLPYQTVDTFRKTIDHIAAWRPDRIALFNYAHVPWIKPHQAQMPTEAMPAPREKLAIFIDSLRRFREHGYTAIGLDHLAIPEDDLAKALAGEELRRNFMGYTTQPQTESLAFGVTGISEISGTYIQNLTRLSDYQRTIRAGELPTERGLAMSDDDRIRNDVIMDLMCNLVIHKPAIAERYSIDFDEYFADALDGLRSMQEDGLVKLLEDRVEVTDRGQLLVRNAAMFFDAYLEPAGEGDKPLYSRTV